MFEFSNTSKDRLLTCDLKLQCVFRKVIENFDCTVLTGHRNKEDQDRAFAEGRSKHRWPNSKHNSLPARAIDVAPYPINWADRERFVLFAGYVLGVADELGIKLRWGGDWDGDRDLSNNTFDDLAHFELL